MSKHSSLTGVLWSCFKQYIGTEEESKLHEENFVTKKLKQCLGKDEFEKWDQLHDKIWFESWREFDILLLKMNN